MPGHEARSRRNRTSRSHREERNESQSEQRVRETIPRSSHSGLAWVEEPGTSLPNHLSPEHSTEYTYGQVAEHSSPEPSQDPYFAANLRGTTFQNLNIDDTEQDSQSTDIALVVDFQNLGIENVDQSLQLTSRLQPIGQHVDDLDVLATQNPLIQVQSVYTTATASSRNTQTQINEPGFLQDGHHSSRLLLGTSGDRERLWPEYRMRPSKFFSVGRVFFTLWAEPVGESSFTQWDDASLIPGIYEGERVYSKVRRFVVIREGDQYCSAVPIVTYRGYGVAKRGVNKSEHAIIHTSRAPPNPLPGERSARDGSVMLPIPIRVQPDNVKETLDPASRIDFGKVHTIQHNLKVKPLGKVHQNSAHALMEQFNTVFSASTRHRIEPRGTSITQSDGHGSDVRSTHQSIGLDDFDHYGTKQSDDYNAEDGLDSGSSNGPAAIQTTQHEHAYNDQTESQSQTPRSLQSDHAEINMNALQGLFDIICSYMREGRTQEQAIAAHAERVMNVYGQEYADVVTETRNMLSVYAQNRSRASVDSGASHGSRHYSRRHHHGSSRYDRQNH